MGDRVSISFVKDGEESVTLFSHWDGMGLVEQAEEYVKQLKTTTNGRTTPLDRLQPNTVMVDFIRILTRELPKVDSNYYLAKDESEGDNSDNGHHKIRL